MFSLVQNLRNGRMARLEVPGPAWDENQVLVRNLRSVLSPGTEKLILDLAKKSLLGKARARPDLLRTFLEKARREGLSAALAKANARLDAPSPVGYSTAGVVLEAGARVDGLAPGTRVACAGARYASHADLVAVPHRLCVRVPDGVSDEDAAFTTLGAIALQGLRQAEAALGEIHGVLGLGIIGLLTVQILRAAGCRVLAQDPDPARRALAEELGAETASPEDIEALAERASEGRGLDAVLVTAATPSSAPVVQAGRLCRHRGRVVVVGAVGMDIPRDQFYRKELEIRLSMSYGPGRYDPDYEERGRDYPQAYVRWTEQRNMAAFLDLVAGGDVTPSRLVTHRFPFGRALEAYGLLEGGEPYLGVVLEYGESPDLSRSLKLGETPQPLDGAPRLGLLGAGGFLQGVWMPRLKKRKLAVPWVVTATGASAVSAARRLGAARAGTDSDEMLADGDVDAVFITTRHHLHAEQAAAALAAGKHVFLEKPLAIRPEELEVLEKVHGEAGRHLMVGFNRRFSSHARAARELLAGRGPLSMLYRVNAGRLPAGSWIQDPEEGGGRIVGEACHFIDLMSFLCGSRPVGVQAFAAEPGREDLPEAENFTAVLSFADGSRGSLHYWAGGSVALPKEYLEAQAGGASALIDDFRLSVLAHEGKRRRLRGRGQDKGFDAELDAFLASLREGRPAIPFEDILATTRATFAILESLRRGGPVEIP